jgi:hypothetical protein
MREFTDMADMEYSSLSKIERGVTNTTFPLPWQYLRLWAFLTMHFLILDFLQITYRAGLYSN